MALPQKNIIEIPMAAGPKQKTDPYQLKDGLLLLENGAFDKQGAINKRRGFARFGDDQPADKIGNVAIGQSSYLGKGLEDSEPVQIAVARDAMGTAITTRLQRGAKLWSHSNGWHQKANAPLMEAVLKEVASDDGLVISVDIAYIPSVQADPDDPPTHCCVVYMRVDGVNIYTHAIVYDMASGTRVLKQQLTNADAVNNGFPVLWAYEGTFYIFTTGGGFLHLHRITGSGYGYAMGVRCAIVGPVTASTFDIGLTVNVTPYWVVVYRETTNLRIDTLSLAGTVLMDNDLVAAGVNLGHVRVHVQPDDSLIPLACASWTETNAGLRDVCFATWTIDAAGQLTVERARTLVVTTPAGSDVIALTSCPDPRDYVQAFLMFTDAETGATAGPAAHSSITTHIYKIEVQVGANVLLRHIHHTHLYSHPQIWNGRPYFMVRYQPLTNTRMAGNESIQPSYMLLSFREVIYHNINHGYQMETEGIFLQGKAIGSDRFDTLRLTHLCGMNQSWRIMPADPTSGEEDDCKRFGCPLVRMDYQMEAKDAQSSFRAIVVAELDTHHWSKDSQKATDSKVGETRQLALGGYVADYTGETAAEPNFFIHPEQLDVLVTNAGGNIGAGTIWVTACYEWQDARGQIHVSAPAPAVSVVTAGATNILDVWVPTLQHSADVRKLSDVKVQIYRTEPDGTVFYRVPMVDGRLDNNPNVPAVQFTDDGTYPGTAFPADVSILYTSGGVLENAAPPASNIICEHGGRLVFIPNDDRTKIRYSKQIALNEGISCPPEFEIQTPRESGDIVGLFSMSGRLGIMKETSVYVVSGEGPNEMMGGQVFGPPEEITNSIGCVSRGTIIPLGSPGIAFKSKGRFALLSPGFQISDELGKDITDYDNWTIRAGVHLPRESQVRFLARQGSNTVLLAMDYSAGQWSVWTFEGALPPTEIAAIGWAPASSYQNGFGYLSSSGTGTAGESLACRESNGYQDVTAAGTIEYALKIGSPWFAVGGLQGFQILWWLHLLGLIKSSHTLSVQLFYNYETTGGEIETFEFKATGPMLVRLKPTIMKCTAVRFVVWDSVNSKTSGYSLSSLALLIGSKGRLRPLPKSKTMVVAP